MIGWIGFAVAFVVSSAVTWWWGRRRRRAAEKLPPIRLWRRLPMGRQAVHRYVGQLEDLQSLTPHLGMRIYVRRLDRVYQWGIGRREEVDGELCVFPEEPAP